MTLASGFGGAVVLGNGTSIDAFVKTWAMNDTAQLHDVSVMGSGVVARSFLKGLETLSITLDFVADSNMDLTTLKPGGVLTNLTLDATGVTPAKHEYIVANSVVETVNFTKDVDQMARGTMTVRGSQATTMTRPDGDGA